MYPFGYGLSYSSFKYSNMQIKSTEWPIKITIDLTNTGKVEASEITQLYINDEESSIEKAVNELKGFTKTKLSPNETKTLRFTLSKEDFSYFDALSKEWKLESGFYNIKIGANSRDLKLVDKIKL